MSNSPIQTMSAERVFWDERITADLNSLLGLAQEVREYSQKLRERLTGPVKEATDASPAIQCSSFFGNTEKTLECIRQNLLETRTNIDQSV